MMTVRQDKDGLFMTCNADGHTGGSVYLQGKDDICKRCKMKQLEAEVRVLREQVKEFASAMAYAYRAIEDAIGCEDGLDGASGASVLEIMEEASDNLLSNGVKENDLSICIAFSRKVKAKPPEGE